MILLSLLVTLNTLRNPALYRNKIHGYYHVYKISLALTYHSGKV
jgi:hypothetical protein